MTRIAIVDDHEIVRRGFNEMLQDESSFTVVCEASSGEEILSFLQNDSCDVVLLDISLPGQSGVDVLRHLRQRYEKLAVLVLSGHPEEQYAIPMIRNGANGYLNKNCEQAELIEAIRTVSLGRRYLSATTAQLFASEMLNENEVEPHKNLSERELQVFLRLCDGSSVSEIGNVLNLSVKTISTYRSRLMEKMSLGSNAELAIYAVKHGLINHEI